MDEKARSKSTIFIRLNPSECEHLKPLSVYSKMITDLGCFVDDYSPPGRPDSGISASIEKTDALRSEIKETVNSKLCSEHVGCGTSTEQKGYKGTKPHSFKQEEVVLNLAPAFDCDVDDMLCLNPVGTHSAGGFSKNVKSCKSSSLIHNNPVLISTVAHGRELEKRDGQVDEERAGMRKEMHLNAKDEEADKGYFSMSYIKDPKIGKSPRQLSTAASSSLHRIGEVEGPQDEYHPERSSEQAMLCEQHNLFPESDLSPIVSGPLESVNSDSLDGDVDDMWNIGSPIFESSLCHSVAVKLNADSEKSRQVTEEVRAAVMEPIDVCHATHSGEEATLDTSYETTLPLQVQVKSVVMVPNQHTTSKPGAFALPHQKAKPTRLKPYERVSQSIECVRRSQRPTMFDTKVDWEHGKRSYVHAVTRHVTEKPGTAQDVMSELLNLMTHVADQSANLRERQWQHPSDLTKRNYQRRWGNITPTISLDEWQAKNCTAHKRFAQVPKIFERSPFP
uniref:S100P-binding protein n=1 Tax=Seriola dumerili TaxID=41447 RepID=A0A3B4UIK0_SERDU